MCRSTTGDWSSGNPAFAISHGPCRTSPSASSSDSCFSDMLFSPPAFAFRSIGWPRSISSELLLTASEIQPRVPRRTLSPHTAQAFQTPSSEDAVQQPKLLRLYDTPLQTTHVAIGWLPLDGTPVNGLTQARASSALKRGFKFPTNSCLLRHCQRVSYRNTTRKSARLPVL